MWPQGWIYGAAIALLDGQSHKMELLNGRVLTQKIADFPILWKYLVRWRGTNLIIWLKCVVWWTNNDSPRILLQVLGLTFFSVCTFFLRMSLKFDTQNFEQFPQFSWLVIKLSHSKSYRTASTWNMPPIISHSSNIVYIFHWDHVF